MGDIKYQLRKVGFPQCANDALKVIEQLIIAHNAGRTVISNSMDLALEIIDEFVFRERSGVNAKVRSLNSIQELQLLEVLCCYFSSGGNIALPVLEAAAVRYAVFLCLFPSGNESKYPVLAKLISMAVATRSKHVLAAAGTWLQQTGPASPSGLVLARSIVTDFFLPVPEAMEQLRDLPTLSPVFASNFMAAVVELYCTLGTEESLPPPSLLKVVAFWADQSPALCTGALINTMPSAIPFLGIVRWCVLAPLYNAADSEPYSQLHLALLESLLSSSRESLILAHQLAAIVSVIVNLLPSAEPIRLKQALDRFTQIVIVLLRTGSIAGNVAELFKKMDSLPKSELLENFHNCQSSISAPPYFRLPQRS